MKIQLNKYIALCGISSRRKANLYILDRRVKLNGIVVNKLGQKVDIDKDEIYLDDKLLEIPSFVYVLLNKPAGVITSAVDKRGRKTVMDIVDSRVRVFPVGRLDMDTEGVLLLTNDGDLGYRLAHPKFEIDKIYFVRVRGKVTDKTIAFLKNGVEIDPDVVVCGDAKILKYTKDGNTEIEIKIHQGKKRQIKRMMKKSGHPVIYLNRKVFAGLTAEGVKTGAWRYLTSEEVDFLYSMVGLKRKAG